MGVESVVNFKHSRCLLVIRRSEKDFSISPTAKRLADLVVKMPLTGNEFGPAKFTEKVY